MGIINKIMPYAFPFIIVGLGILYYLVNPMHSEFTIQCPWYILTRTQCPACGLQRALHTLVHGNFLNALRYNYFFIFSIPYAFAAILSAWYNINHIFDKLKFIIFHRCILKLYIILYFSWWIIRNIYNI